MNHSELLRINSFSYLSSTLRYAALGYACYSVSILSSITYRNMQMSKPHPQQCDRLLKTNTF